MEIEKKFLVKNLPDDFVQYPKYEIEQCYLCMNPTIRIRRKDEQYILTYKNRNYQDLLKKDEKLCVAEEIEVALDKKSYEHLKTKADGKTITKTRYLLPYQGKTIELDIFHNEYDGFLMAEVEFESIEESRLFQPPAWFGEEVSGDYHYTNSYLAAN